MFWVKLVIIKGVKELFKFPLFIGVAIFFSGCGVQEKISSLSNSIIIPYEEATHKVESSFDHSLHFMKKQYQFFENQLKSTKSNIFENKIFSYIIPDEMILENRKNFIIWSATSGLNYQSIIEKKLNQKNLLLKEKELPINQKLALLNDYFFEKEQDIYIKNFQKNYPMPIFDEFLTDRENVIKFNEYKIELINSKNQWEYNLPTIQKKVATEALSTLYGKINVKNIRYNPDSEKLYLEIHSDYNNFVQEIYLNLSPEMGKAFKSNHHKIKPLVYFDFKEEMITLIGVTILFNEIHYLANLSNTQYVRNSTIQLQTNDTQLNLQKLDIDYRTVSKNSTPPQWFYKLEKHENQIIGYGVGITIEEAKRIALQEISETIEVSIISESSFEKTMHGEYSSSKKQSAIQTRSKSKNLKGVETKKSELKDGLHYVAVQYEQNNI